MEEVDRKIDIRLAAGIHGQKHPHSDEPDADKLEAVGDELQQHKEEGDKMEGEEKEK